MIKILTRYRLVKLCLIAGVIALLKDVSLAAISDLLWSDGTNTLTRAEAQFYWQHQEYDWLNDPEPDVRRMLEIEIKVYKANASLVPVFRDMLKSAFVGPNQAAGMLQFILERPGDYSALLDCFRVQCQHKSTFVVRYAVQALGKYGNEDDIDTIASFLHSNIHVNSARNDTSVRRSCLIVLKGRGSKRHQPEIRKYITDRMTKITLKQAETDELLALACQTLQETEVRELEGELLHITDADERQQVVSKIEKLKAETQEQLVKELLVSSGMFQDN